MKRILFLAHRIPYPPNKGDKIRSFHEMQALSTEYEIDLITFVDSKSDLVYRNNLSNLCNDIYIYYLNKIIGLAWALIFFILGKSLSEGYYFNLWVFFRVRSLIKRKNYEVIFCYSAQVAQYVLKLNNKKRIMDYVDVDSDKWLQYSRQKKFPLNILYKIESRRLLKYEKKISKRFSLSIFSTDTERNIFEKHSSNENITVINNGVDSEYFYPIDAKKENALVFVGAMDYFPNIDAVTWFTHNVFLDLVKKIPDLIFYIVGSYPTREIKELSKLSKNIIITDFVNDVRPYLAKAKFAVMPIRIARGIQNKILEAMAMTIPVIINEKLYNSLSNLNRKDIFIYKDAEELSQIIINNIDDNERLSQIGNKLRKYVIKNYCWDVNLNLMKNKIRNLDTKCLQI